MTRVSLLALILCAASPVWAADVVTVSTEDCRRLVAHSSSADYKPGVDVHGKPVVPADLNSGTTIDLPSVIEIPLTLDVIRRLQDRAPAGNDILSGRRGLEGRAPLGTLTIKGNDAFWNGKPLQSQDEVLMAEACRSSLRARGIVLPEAKPEPPK